MRKVGITMLLLAVVGIVSVVPAFATVTDIDTAVTALGSDMQDGFVKVMVIAIALAGAVFVFSAAVKMVRRLIKSY